MLGLRTLAALCFTVVFVFWKLKGSLKSNDFAATKISGLQPPWKVRALKPRHESLGDGKKHKVWDMFPKSCELQKIGRPGSFSSFQICPGFVSEIWDALLQNSSC